jgi:AhpD family alkylhydroperoxidase
MQARMKSPVLVFPESLKHLQAVSKSLSQGGVPAKTLKLVDVRVSQINGCSLCLDMHSHELRKLGEEDKRLFAIAAWREAPYFTAAERAALALGEAISRMSDREDPVPDAVWDEAARHYDEKGLATLVLAIAQINVWNRINVPTRQPADGWRTLVG